MKKTIFLSALLSFFSAVYSQEEGDTTAVVGGTGNAWIDQQLTRCLDQGNLTLPEQNECLYTALSAWEEAVNDEYSLLLSQLDEPAKSSLKKSQTAWVAYKNAQFTFLSDHYGSMVGAMYRQIEISERIKVVKKRYTEVFNLTQD
jgi:uncharacterized protein YecT (DUF1311 family)